MTRPTCLTCSYSITPGGDLFQVCVHAKVNLTSAYSPCHIERNESNTSGECGKEGKLWEPFDDPTN